MSIKAIVLIACLVIVSYTSIVIAYVRLPCKFSGTPLLLNSFKDAVDTLQTKSAFIFGLGYVGKLIALKLRADGWKVSATCTSRTKAEKLNELGIETYLFDGTSKIPSMVSLRECSYILSTVPPYSNATLDPTLECFDPVLKYYEDDIMQYAYDGKIKWIGYLSSTGVYGECQGAWVNEESIPQPTTEKARARHRAEASWLNLLRRGLPVKVMRLSGIYGPKRSALDSAKRIKGDLRQSNSDIGSVISRVHVDDIVQLLYVSMNNPNSFHGIVNVADDCPSSKREALVYASQLIGYKVTEKDDIIQSNKQLRGGSKRVENKKMKDILRDAGASLLYNDFKSGLDAIYKQEA